MRHQITIPQRFCGPPNSGNGGYSCGSVARHLDGLVEVRLHAPPPLETPLALAIDGASAELWHGDRLIASARPTDWNLPVPEAPTLAQAREARERYRGFRRHPLPSCFVCGTGRAPGDGLNIFSGRLEEGSNVVATTWDVDASLPNEGGILADEIVYAALDCPGFSAVRDVARFALLGSFSARLFRPVRVGERLIAVGWPAGSEGRKHRAGTALFNDRRELVAEALATWVSVPEEAFLESLG